MNHKTAVLRNAKLEASSKPIKIAASQQVVDMDKEKEVILSFKHTSTNMPIYALVAKKDLEKSEGASPLLSSVSIHDPLNGIIRAEYNFVPFACVLCPKNTPGERCS